MNETMAIGRPTKYSTELAERICLHLSYGATHRMAAESEGIDEKTFYNWLKKPDFFQAVRASEARARTQKLALLHQAAARGSVPAMTWLLERLDPQAYGEPPKRVEVTGKGGEPITVIEVIAPRPRSGSEPEDEEDDAR